MRTEHIHHRDDRSAVGDAARRLYEALVESAETNAVAASHVDNTWLRAALQHRVDERARWAAELSVLDPVEPAEAHGLLRKRLHRQWMRFAHFVDGDKPTALLAELRRDDRDLLERAAVALQSDAPATLHATFERIAIALWRAGDELATVAEARPAPSAIAPARSSEPFVPSPLGDAHRVMERSRPRPVDPHQQGAASEPERSGRADKWEEIERAPTVGPM